MNKPNNEDKIAKTRMGKNEPPATINQPDVIRRKIPEHARPISAGFPGASPSFVNPKKDLILVGTNASPREKADKTIIDLYAQNSLINYFDQ
ncbi:MAG TPA: hypothetical protein VFE98_08310 [Candidatus Bathyarchaeia archaeon]|nr:hypothetical protein [Candidatus Bathyarchaeia archaeon]